MQWFRWLDNYVVVNGLFGAASSIIASQALIRMLALGNHLGAKFRRGCISNCSGLPVLLPARAGGITLTFLHRHTTVEKKTSVKGDVPHLTD